MLYSFNTEHAKKYGVDEAIMIQNFVFWINKNIANEKHFINDRHWTYNSASSFSILFPFWNESKIRRILDSLISQGVLMKDVFNQKKYDRTSWYAFINEAEFLDLKEKASPENDKCICQICKMDVSEMADECCENGGPIPDSKPDGKTDKNSKKGKKVYSDETMELSRYYWKVMNKPISLVNLEEMPDNWIKPLDNLLKKGIPLQTIKNVIDFANNELFWRRIIISTDAFNKQFEKVELQLRNTPPPKQPDSEVDTIYSKTSRYRDE